MNLLVVGSGGREHALIRKLRESPRVTRIFAWPGNGGIARDAMCVPGDPKDIAGIVRFAQAQNIDFAVVAPDDPLVLGAVDALEAAGVPCFGPDAKAAAIEGSKVFSKGLMRKYQIPTARYATFDSAEETLAYIRAGAFPVVVKADGLALGKGVRICETLAEAEDAVQSIMCDKVFGASGNQVVVEEFLTGPEVSVLAFTDGKTMSPMVSSMDHKRALDGDRGLNTGGMGAIAPNPYYDAAMASRCMEEIFLPTMRAMCAEGRPFHGCLYFGLMLTPDGPKVIEYNCRFGDPEAQAVLSLLDTDLLTIMEATRAGTLDQVDIRWKQGASCCVMLASGGYPTAYRKGLPIDMGDAETRADVTVYHSGTKLSPEGKLLTAGGRVLGVTAIADTLRTAIDQAYAAADAISFEDVHLRRDIGKRALEKERYDGQ